MLRVTPLTITLTTLLVTSCAGVNKEIAQNPVKKADRVEAAQQLRGACEERAEECSCYAMAAVDNLSDGIILALLEIVKKPESAKSLKLAEAEFSKASNQLQLATWSKAMVRCPTGSELIENDGVK